LFVKQLKRFVQVVPFTGFAENIEEEKADPPPDSPVANVVAFCEEAKVLNSECDYGEELNAPRESINGGGKRKKRR
jgi:hypothetical protein